MTAISRLAQLLILSACLVACGDDDDDDDHDEGGEESHGDGGHEQTDGGTGEHPDCAAISEACHGPDTMDSGDIHECHSEIAHHNDPVECAAEKDRCIALCEAASGDAGHTDHD